MLRIIAVVGDLCECSEELEFLGEVEGFLEALEFEDFPDQLDHEALVLRNR